VNPSVDHSVDPSVDPPPEKRGVLLRVGLFILIGFLGLQIFSVVFSLFPSPLATAALADFAAAAVANAIVVRIYERGRLADLGLGWTPVSGQQFLTGAVTGAVAGALILTGPLALGLAKFQPAQGVDHPWASFAFVSILLLFGAFGEEMLFRGYAFQLLIRSFGAFATIFSTSVLFGLAHLGNQNVVALGIINTIAWGFLFGYAYYRTQALWLPIGLHFGWNFALPLFGVNLSGFTMSVTGYALKWSVGNLWSGGGYGPEGGLPTTLIVVVLFFVLRRVTRPVSVTE
jgi:membrane protease YdiL (CAAX protease family)